MSKLLKLHPKWTKDTAFRRCSRVSIKRYNDEISSLIRDACKNMGPKETRVIYLDKNHRPLGGIRKAINLIDF